jgi:hypothetical protein
MKDWMIYGLALQRCSGRPTRTSFQVVHSVHFLYQSTLLITPTKCTILINTNIKGPSPTFCNTSVPSSGRTK